MKKVIFFSLLLSGIISCNSDDDGDYEVVVSENITTPYLGGETTIFDSSENAYGFQAPNLDSESAFFFFTGNSLFNQSWVTAPASTTAVDGLGPLFNARACSGCHFKDGRGRPQEFTGEISAGLLFRLSVPGVDEYGRNLPDPNYGGQLQDFAIGGVDAEGTININYSPIEVVYPDGTKVELQDPNYSFTDLKYGEMSPELQVSPRVANQMVGLGLLDAIEDETIVNYADEFDSNNDGISGKPNYVYYVASNSKVLGRFGWKSNQPSLRQQVAGAFLGDLGITSSLFPDENCPTGIDCDQMVNGNGDGDYELTDSNLDLVTLYSATLAVPGKRNNFDEDVLEGESLFEKVNCIACHIPNITTGSYSIAAMENQDIHPFTDLLLHDMGDGLADNTPDFDANGNEWRTAPLWGIGLIETVNGHTRLLHDGRARNVEEAILWHGGEAEASKLAFMDLNVEERTKVIGFINSL